MTENQAIKILEQYAFRIRENHLNQYNDLIAAIYTLLPSIRTYKVRLEDRDQTIKELNNEIEGLKNNELDYTTIYINGKFDGEKKITEKIRKEIKEIKELKETFKEYKEETKEDKAEKEFWLDQIAQLIIQQKMLERLLKEE